MPLDDGWMAYAACRAPDVDPAVFFPKQGLNSASEAKEVCFKCPVQRTCLKYAIAHNIPHGVWGGYTAHERRWLFDRKFKVKIRRRWFATHPFSRPMRNSTQFLPREEVSTEDERR